MQKQANKINTGKDVFCFLLLDKTIVKRYSPKDAEQPRKVAEQTRKVAGQTPKVAITTAQTHQPLTRIPKTQRSTKRSQPLKGPHIYKKRYPLDQSTSHSLC